MLKKVIELVVATTLVFGMASSNVMASEIYFQKTYVVDGMDAETIKEAFGEKVMRQGKTAVESWGDVLKAGSSEWLEGKDKQEYPLRCSAWGSSTFLDAEILLQAKDGKYRLTISDIISDGGDALNKMNRKFKSKCLKQIEMWADKKYERVKKLAF